ncbi:methyl-accepting chemotaxis protein [Aestuariirhabdus haliotis]|uniref:methyl-accepting chemotaxis protein n=1 Tax=Aestuariirhabdus haliotis TaxID=2918751 RepID=UPI0020C13E05|nr:methyl-accepting chemotaxis protein [Aestuariirhabdus haliotis]MCL6418142.1 methyl-accepting chemotaxis protein [Aestuariirhabdus haliotis]
MNNLDFSRLLIPILAGIGSALLIGLALNALLPDYMALFVASLTAIVVSLTLASRSLSKPTEAVLQYTLDSLHGNEGQAPQGSEQHDIIAALSDLSSRLQALESRSSQIAIAAAEVSHQSDSITSKVHAEVSDVEGIAEAASRIQENANQVNQSADEAAQLGQETLHASEAGKQAIDSATQQMRETSEKAQETSSFVASLETKSNQIQQITSVISGIAEQTNLLALNAAIEAARAGEQGRGFAVVADEVRNLAQKTTAATDEIGVMISGISGDIQKAVETMSTLGEAISQSENKNQAVADQLGNIHDLVGNMQQQAANISDGAAANKGEVDGIGVAIESVRSHLHHTEQSVEQVSDRALQVSDVAEEIHSSLMELGVQSLHSDVRAEAEAAASAIVERFERDIASGDITLEDLFDRDYQPVKDTNPQKFTTRFDSYTDRVLPPIQEPILDRSKELAYAGATDDKGYFGTHNKRYSKPLTGDYEKDLLNSRTKRVFGDRTGQRCAKNTTPCLLQTYKRDTGEVMHDLSVPIYLKGRHWGCFRIGYRANDE